MNVSFGKTVIIRDNIGKRAVAADSKQISIIQKPEEDKNNTQYEIWGNTPYPMMIVKRNPRNNTLNDITEQLNCSHASNDGNHIVDINSNDNTKTEQENLSYKVFPSSSKDF